MSTDKPNGLFMVVDTLKLYELMSEAFYVNSIVMLFYFRDFGVMVFAAWGRKVND